MLYAVFRRIEPRGKVEGPACLTRRGVFFLCGDRWALAAGPGDQLPCGMGRPLCLRVQQAPTESYRVTVVRSLSAGRLQGYLVKFILHVQGRLHVLVQLLVVCAHENPSMILTLVNLHSGGMVTVDGGTRACSVPVTVTPRVSKRFPR
jgi:hypothetical protein